MMDDLRKLKCSACPVVKIGAVGAGRNLRCGICAARVRQKGAKLCTTVCITKRERRRHKLLILLWRLSGSNPPNRTKVTAASPIPLAVYAALIASANSMINFGSMATCRLATLCDPSGPNVVPLASILVAITPFKEVCSSSLIALTFFISS